MKHAISLWDRLLRVGNNREAAIAEKSAKTAPAKTLKEKRAAKKIKAVGKYSTALDK